MTCGWQEVLQQDVGLNQGNLMSYPSSRILAIKMARYSEDLHRCSCSYGYTVFCKVSLPGQTLLHVRGILGRRDMGQAECVPSVCMRSDKVTPVNPTRSATRTKVAGGMQILDPVQCVAVMKELGAYSNTWPITMALAEQHSNDAKVRLSSATLSFSSCQSRASMLTAMEDIPA